jgi:hypothetical protein
MIRSMRRVNGVTHSRLNSERRRTPPTGTCDAPIILCLLAPRRRRVEVSPDALAVAATRSFVGVGSLVR